MIVNIFSIDNGVETYVTQVSTYNAEPDFDLIVDQETWVYNTDLITNELIPKWDYKMWQNKTWCSTRPSDPVKKERYDRISKTLKRMPSNWDPCNKMPSVLDSRAIIYFNAQKRGRH